MAQSITGTKISALTAAGTLSGSELAVVVQGGSDRRTTVQAIANRAPSQAPPVADLVGGGGAGFTAVTAGAGVTLLNSVLTGIPLTTTQAGTTYTLTDTDRGKTFVSTNSSTVALTVPAGLTHPYQLTIVQYGPGAIVPTADGVTLGNNAGDTRTNGFRSVCALISVAPDIYVFSGDTAP
jgi:hypothetical protein